MTNTIDWTAPLEAYHPDGRVMGVEETALDPELPGKIWVKGIGWFYDTGIMYMPKMEWQIRNRASQYPPELVEALRAVCDADHLHEAHNVALKALAALPQPVDADLELARDCVASSMHDRDKSWGDLVRAGERDDCPEMRMVIAAIKRVRAEKG